jgi:hypothetical protein
MQPMAEGLIPILVVGCFVAIVAVAGELECEGPHKGRTLTSETLATVLRNHQVWLKAGGEPNDERRANLCQADLHGANLQEVILQDPKLQGADLTGVNLQGAIYEPNPEELPALWTLTDPRNNLDKLVFHRSPAGLIALREGLKKAGMRTQERQLTYAIEYTKRLQAWNPSWHDPKEEDPRPWQERLSGKGESLLSYLYLELPSGYGMTPHRAMADLGLLILEAV